MTSDTLAYGNGTAATEALINGLERLGSLSDQERRLLEDVSLACAAERNRKAA